MRFDEDDALALALHEPQDEVGVLSLAVMVFTVWCLWVHSCVVVVVIELTLVAKKAGWWGLSNEFFRTVDRLKKQAVAVFSARLVGFHLLRVLRNMDCMVDCGGMSTEPTSLAVILHRDILLTMTFSIWDDWLRVGRRIEYRNFRHVEYEEHADQRDRIADRLRSVIENHHARSSDWIQLVGSIGFPSLAAALKRSYVTLPSRTMPSSRDGEEEQELTTRRGNFCEVLAAEFAVTQLGFEVPIRRLRYNPNPDQSMKGDDVLGFRFPMIHGSAGVLVGESKYRSSRSPSAVRNAVEPAYRSLCLSHRSYPVSMDFVATMLEMEQDHESAQSVRQMRAQLQSGKVPVERHYLIFLGTLDMPDNPFVWLDEQPEVVANVTCVNIVFAPGIQSWLGQLFDRD